MSLSPTSKSTHIVRPHPIQTNRREEPEEPIKFLIPEDDEFTRQILTSMLKKAQQDQFPQDVLEIHEAKNAIEAKDILQNQHQKNAAIDAVISDNDMPTPGQPGGSNEGVRLMYRIASAASDERSLPVRAMNSATLKPEKLRKAVSLLGSPLLLKPVSQEKISRFYAENRDEIRERQRWRQNNPNNFNIFQPARQLPVTEEEVLNILEENDKLRDNIKSLEKENLQLKRQAEENFPIPEPRKKERPDLPPQTELESPTQLKKGCCTDRSFCNVF
jgi:CheY-like chemotaxis protein